MLAIIVSVVIELKGWSRSQVTYAKRLSRKRCKRYTRLAGYMRKESERTGLKKLNVGYVPNA